MHIFEHACKSSANRRPALAARGRRLYPPPKTSAKIAVFAAGIAQLVEQRIRNAKVVEFDSYCRHQNKRTVRSGCPFAFPSFVFNTRRTRNPIHSGRSGKREVENTRPRMD